MAEKLTATYTSREAAEQVICKACERPICPRLWGDDCDSINRLNTTPAADVVEVVRCKDCFAYQRVPELAEMDGLNPAEYCALLRCEFGPDGFCSYGRRADNG